MDNFRSWIRRPALSDTPSALINHQLFNLPVAILMCFFLFILGCSNLFTRPKGLLKTLLSHSSSWEDYMSSPWAVFNLSSIKWHTTRISLKLFFTLFFVSFTLEPNISELNWKPYGDIIAQYARCAGFEFTKKSK